jgi:type I restriction enzyme S subunit
MMLARTFPVVQITVPMAINQDLKGVSGFANVRNDYLAWLLRGTSAETLNRLDEAGHGTMALRMEVWTSMKLPIPHLEEQAEIASHLAATTQVIDDLIAEVTRGLDLLGERRSALISAAVIGKIDVRGQVAREAAA